MKSFTSIITAAALIAGIAAAPLKIRDNCGSAPSASGTQTPLSQPSGISTASACQAQCEANTSCESFVFGMVNNVDECILYSVAASSVPTQSSTNLVAYDKACSSVPSVVPTTSNPTGASTSGSNTSNTGSTTSNTGSTTSNTGSTTSNTGSDSTSNSNSPAQGGQQKRDICGAAPTGPSGNANPITQQNVESLTDCKALAESDPSCKS